MQYTNLSSNGGNKRKGHETRQDKAKFFKQPQFLKLHLVQGVSNWAEMVQNGPKWSKMVQNGLILLRSSSREEKDKKQDKIKPSFSSNNSYRSTQPQFLKFHLVQGGPNGANWVKMGQYCFGGTFEIQLKIIQRSSKVQQRKKIRKRQNKAMFFKQFYHQFTQLLFLMLHLVQGGPKWAEAIN